MPENLTRIAQPVPELPVADVPRAQAYYRDTLGFTVEWTYGDGEIGAVSRADVVVFFRRRREAFEPAVHWVFAEDVDATYEEMKAAGANVVQPIADTPWGLRQFTIVDLDGNRFHVYHG